MRTNLEILDVLINMVINYQHRTHRHVRKIVIPEKYYQSLLTELQAEGLNTIYGTELRSSTRIKSIALT